MADAATLTLTLDPDLLESFVAEIDQALREADDPAVKRIPHEEVIARLSRQRAERVRRARGRSR